MNGARLISVCVVSAGLLAARPAPGERWPGLPPDCWEAPRYVHQDAAARDWKSYVSQERVALPPSPPEAKERANSPNQGYYFVRTESDRSAVTITVYAEKEHLLELRFTDLRGLVDVRWINEKLLFLRPWWGRIAATDLIFDVEREAFVWSEFLLDSRLAWQQFVESCKVTPGCRCVRPGP